MYMYFQLYYVCSYKIHVHVCPYMDCVYDLYYQPEPLLVCFSIVLVHSNTELALLAT